VGHKGREALASEIEWHAMQYGGISYLKLGTDTAIVFTDRRLVKQLIDKKRGSQRHSSRITSSQSAIMSW
jgi:hypothetical protein